MKLLAAGLSSRVFATPSSRQAASDSGMGCLHFLYLYVDDIGATYQRTLKAGVSDWNFAARPD